MSEFSSSATIDVSVSSSSLRSARDTIESELGDVQVNASSATGGGSGSRIAGRERGMARQLQTETNNHLGENLSLNEERNDLLRQLVDVTEKDAQTTRGRGGGMAAGAIGLAVGGIGLGSALLGGLGSTLSDAMPDFDASDLIEAVAVDPSDVVTSTAVMASDLIDTAASLEPANVIASAAALTPAALIASKAGISPSDLVESQAGISPTDLVTEMATVTPGAIIASKAAIAASNLVGSKVDIDPLDLITEAVTIDPSDIVSGTISASAIIDRITDSSSEGGAGGGVGIEEVLGVGAAGVGGGMLGKTILDGVRGVGGAAGRGAAGISTPVFTREMFGMDSGSGEAPAGVEKFANDPGSDPVLGHVIPGGDVDPIWNRTPDVPDTPSASDAREAVNDITQQFDNTVEVNADLSNLERDVSKATTELERRINDIEKELR
ncbi:hypothetical protein [Natronorubrum halophilum]|uniref:hypothetical protein n=1 Tax=Natronorubrum halophilum TaxID=1702106 RepID=UPI0010C19569|nr:hypothetical protein [Natronorubrum halophilum]